jgi:hypothetical protein
LSSPVFRTKDQNLAHPDFNTFVFLDFQPKSYVVNTGLSSTLLTIKNGTKILLAFVNLVKKLIYYSQ